jgi:hypothetical protein
MTGQSSPNLLRNVSDPDFMDEQTRNMAMGQMVQQAFVKFGNQKGSKSP